MPTINQLVRKGRKKIVKDLKLSPLKLWIIYTILLAILAIGGLLLGIAYFSVCMALSSKLKKARIRKTLPKKESWERLNDETRRFDG